MKIKINIYTSFYKKMLQRHKQENDFYVQISRTLFMPVKGVDNLTMNEMIDFNFGDIFGNMFNSLKEYDEFWRQDSSKGALDDFRNLFTLDSLEISKEELEKSYAKMSDKEKQEFAKIGITEDEANFNFYLLCFEDLNSTYTKKDEEKFNGLVKQGEKKKCHRTILANILNTYYNLEIKEY